MSQCMYEQHPIPVEADIAWYALSSMVIADNQEPLVDTQTLSGVITQPMYFLQGIAGALPRCYVRASVASKLQQVSHSLPSGYQLVVLDGWRPLSVQQQLRTRFLAEIKQRYPELTALEQQRRLDEFVARPSVDPLCPSPHLTGGSVDVSVCDAEGNVLDMGSAFDAPVPASWTSALEALPATPAQRNRRLLYHSMLAQGFSNIAAEWWHFDYGNQLWALRTGQKQAIYGITSHP